MAAGGLSSFSVVVATLLLAVLLLSDILSAGPIAPKSKGDGTSLEENASMTHRKLTRNRRNISWYKQNSDFWNWYKYFTDNGNQEAVQELDRIYLAYLQNKNRAEGRRSYKAYLSHLGDIYKSCADSSDPNCVASYTARAKPEAPKPAPVRTCDPTKDPKCLYAALLQGKSPYLPLVLPAATVKAPASVKAPAPIYMRSPAPMKDPQSGYPFYAPAVQPFLSQEQKAELLRICSSDDVECLQYHLRAAYGYKPSAGPLPSYAHLGCDPKADPNCKPQQKAPSSLYLQYPNCDTRRDPYCAYAASLTAARAPTGPGSCNPLYEDGCNPLTARRLASPPQQYLGEEGQEAHAHRPATPPPATEQRRDPYAMFRDSPTQACDPVRDPYCQYPASPADPRSHSIIRSSPPASDPYAMLRQYMSQAHANSPYATAPEAAQEANANDPFAMFREAASAAVNRHGNPHSNTHGNHHPQQQYPFRQSQYEEPAQEQRHPLGPPGKTKEGHDCFIGYDQECFPLTSAERSAGRRHAAAGPHEAYEPHLNADGSRNGVREPSNPDCDPEYDRDCRLRRDDAEQPASLTPREEDHYQVGAPESDQQEQYESEPYQSGQEEPYMAYPQQTPRMPSFQDLLRNYGQQFPDQDDHRGYADDYRKK